MDFPPGFNTLWVGTWRCVLLDFSTWLGRKKNSVKRGLTRNGSQITFEFPRKTVFPQKIESRKKGITQKRNHAKKETGDERESNMAVEAIYLNIFWYYVKDAIYDIAFLLLEFWNIFYFILWLLGARKIIATAAAKHWNEDRVINLSTPGDSHFLANERLLR